MIWAYSIFKVDGRKASFSELEFTVCVKDYGGKNFPNGVKTPLFICCRIAHMDSVFLYTYYVLLMQFQLP